MSSPFKTKDPKILRKSLKDSLKGSLRFVGSFSPLTSRLIEQKGFDGVYISGAVVSSFLNRPDVGLNTLTELSSFAETVTEACSLPSLVDADTGFGSSLQTAKTVYELEKKGVSGLHIEDQDMPKRCGHLDKKTLISQSKMQEKIEAACKVRSDENFLIVARTDARGVEGMDEAIKRAKAYEEAGADMIFPEALSSKEEFKKFRDQVKIPLLANMTEFGKTNIIPFETFKSIGYNLVIYPVSIWRLALKAVDQGLDLLSQDKQEALLKSMQTRSELYELLNYKAYNEFDTELFNFSLKNKPS